MRKGLGTLEAEHNPNRTIYQPLLFYCTLRTLGNGFDLFIIKRGNQRRGLQVEAININVAPSSVLMGHLDFYIQLE